MKTILIILVFSLIFLAKVQAEEVSITVNGCTIKGTLQVPVSNKQVDVVLIIAGSGPTDRDGNNPLIGKNNAYNMLADLFNRNGIASLRYDKRGIGESKMAGQSEYDLVFDTYINDAIEWINFLKKDKRFSNIIIAGHSEGSLIGIVAANKTGISKFISLSGAGKPIYSILEEQIIVKNNLPTELATKFKGIVDSLKQGYLVKNVGKEFGSLFRASIQPYMISWFKYDPCKEIAKLTIPILVIGGTTDIQVEVEDAQMLSKSNVNSKLAIIENMNHILKEVNTRDRAINIESYSKPDLALSKVLCAKLIEFTKQ